MMNTDSYRFLTKEQLEAEGWFEQGSQFVRDGHRMLPLYEAKMIHHFNHRFGDYRDKLENFGGTALPDVSLERLRDPLYEPLPRYWITEEAVRERLDGRWERNWLFGWRDITNTTNERTIIASVLPLSAVGHTFPLIFVAPENVALLQATLSTFVQDFIARQKIGGTHLTFTYFNQLAVLPPEMFLQCCLWSNKKETVKGYLISRVLELTYVSWELSEYANDYQWNGPPFKWDEERRFQIRCDLDAACFHLYFGSLDEWRQHPDTLRQAFPEPRDAVAYVLDTFPIVKRKDESSFGHYRTKYTVLEKYDAMQRGIDTGIPFQDPLNPMPGPPTDTHGNFHSIYQLDRDNWPTHLHPLHPDWDESVLSAWFGIRQKQWLQVADKQVFPWDGRESFSYAFIPYLMQEKPGEKFEYYRYAAFLAANTENCETLLLEDSLRTTYRELISPLDWLNFPADHLVRTKNIREYLQSKSIIKTDPTSGATTLHDEAFLPPLPPELKPLLPLILTAADNLVRLQAGALDRVDAEKVGKDYTLIATELDAHLVA